MIQKLFIDGTMVILYLSLVSSFRILNQNGNNPCFFVFIDLPYTCNLTNFSMLPHCDSRPVHPAYSLCFYYVSWSVQK